MARTSCGVLTEKYDLRKNVRKRPGKACVISVSACQGLEIKACDFRNSGNRGCYKLCQTTCFLPSFPPLQFFLQVQESHPTWFAVPVTRPLDLEEQVFPCRMSAAHVSGRLKGRWYCLINHLNMPGVINACCVLHNI